MGGGTGRVWRRGRSRRQRAPSRWGSSPSRPRPATGTWQGRCRGRRPGLGGGCGRRRGSRGRRRPRPSPRRAQACARTGRASGRGPSRSSSRGPQRGVPRGSCRRRSGTAKGRNTAPRGGRRRRRGRWRRRGLRSRRQWRFGRGWAWGAVLHLDDGEAASGDGGGVVRRGLLDVAEPALGRGERLPGLASGGEIGAPKGLDGVEGRPFGNEKVEVHRDAGASEDIGVPDSGSHGARGEGVSRCGRRRP